jgi:hypothetical protein
LTRKTLRSALDQVRKESLPPVSQQEFGKTEPYSELKIWFQRGSKEHFHDAGHFWLVVLLSQARNVADAERFLQGLLNDRYTLCKEISREEFTKTVQFYDFVEIDHDFSLHGQFQQAWLVYDVGTEIAVLAETNCEFVAFVWELLD